MSVTSVVGVASARQISDYSSGASTGGFVSSSSGGSSGFVSSSSSSSGGGDGYGGQQQQTTTQRKCTPFYETQTRDQCESYTDRVCTTTHRENCQNVPLQTCSAQVNSKGGRKCFDVNEQRCQLREQVQMQTIQVPITVQKCQKQTGMF